MANCAFSSPLGRSNSDPNDARLPQLPPRTPLAPPEYEITDLHADMIKLFETQNNAELQQSVDLSSAAAATVPVFSSSSAATSALGSLSSTGSTSFSYGSLSSLAASGANSLAWHDLTLIVQGKPIHTSKCLLTSRCPFFEGMFNSHMQESASGTHSSTTRVCVLA